MRIFILLLLILNVACYLWLGGWLRETRGPESLVRQPPQEAPQSLQLLSEVDSEQVAPDSASTCLSVGVFDSTASSDAFMDQLVPLGVTARISLEEVSEEPDWWVHMPPFISRTAALSRLEELQDRNIDSYLIAGGELAQGISLGLFSIRESALLVQEQLAEQGFPSSILEVPRSHTEIWVDVEGLPQEAETMVQWADIIERSPGLEQVEKLCETIAPNV